MWMYLKTIIKLIEPPEAEKRNSLIHLMVNSCASNTVFMSIPMPYPLLPHHMLSLELEGLKTISMEKFMAFPLLPDTMVFMAKGRPAIIPENKRKYFHKIEIKSLY